MRKTILVLTLAALAASGIAALRAPAATPPDLDRALTAQRELVARSPLDPQALNDLGNLLLLADEPAEAEAAYREALEADPGMVAAHYNLGLLLAQRREYKEALRHFETVLDAEPDHAWAHYQMGAILDAKGADARAIKRYARAFRLDPQLSFAEVNPHIIDNEWVTEALLIAYRDLPAASAAPKTYSEPGRIVSLMVPPPEAGAAAEEMAGEDAPAGTEELPVAAPGEDATGATGARPSVPPVEGGGAAAFDAEGAVAPQGRVLREEDLDDQRGLNQARPGGTVYVPPRGGVRSPSDRSVRPPTTQPDGRVNRGGTVRSAPTPNRQRFVPGTPSTGRLDIELLPGPGGSDEEVG